jgi:putative sterol carrier protein
MSEVMASEELSLEVFTQPWAQAWADGLRSNEAYRQAAIKWEGSLLLAMVTQGEDGPGVFLDLHRGDCRGAWVADAKDREEATYILSGPELSWRRILAGELEPTFGLMSGKLKLERGSLASLMPFIAAAKELVATAGRLRSHFPTLPVEEASQP